MSEKEFKTRLKFKKSAKKEWDALGGNVREKFKKQLKKRAESNEALTSLKNQLSGVDFCYKIKLRSDGYRLVYQVTQDDSGVVNVVITVITVDRREDVYESLQDKINKD
ncbi:MULTISPECIES: type II toxin-antitoxin system RelE family toxin [Sodalis]|uniref:mRNA interferase RelE/StbE n=1 Tax=Sodalis ligni TaxID=2697027 RepID=A0A4R1NK14_9GAMM|nr:type II toxin-antitoxin system RelE/ParE family toxin [Sodalis ligni]TCL06281.1 mRNA interferase RelE/StbE [Sodalis ligni]